jgi:3-phenylpropionate/trans-cinnamate dioxygenase ferredoxin reductase subunit
MGAWKADASPAPMADRSTDVLLIGGGVASVRCARALRRHGFGGTITIIGAEGRLPYNRPPLSKELLREDLPDELLDAEPASWYARRSIEVLTAASVVALDPSAGRAALEDGSAIGFERCLLATGAELRPLEIPNADVALMLRTAADARRLRAAALGAGPGAPVVVIGGGFIGLEVASGLATLGLRPTVVEMAPGLWGGALGTRLAAWVADRLARHRIELRLASAVTRLTGDSAWIGDEELPAAVVVAGIGVRPRENLAVGAGLATGDGVLVDDGGRTSHPRVWAAGDVASVSGRRVEHWHAAREAGERAALSMLGLTVPPVPPPWVFSEVAGATLDVVGATDGWDEERWVQPDRVLAYLRAGRVVGLATVDNALPASDARGLVSSGGSIEEVATIVR